MIILFRTDYLCDYGFMLDQHELTLSSSSSACVKDPAFPEHDVYAVPASCAPGGTFNRTRGYIKIRGDSCEGGR